MVNPHRILSILLAGVLLFPGFSFSSAPIAAAQTAPVILTAAQAVYTPYASSWFNDGLRTAKYTYSKGYVGGTVRNAAWKFVAPADGRYGISVRAKFSYTNFYPYIVTDAPYTVSINGVQQGDIIRVDQRNLRDAWKELSSYDLRANDEVKVTVSNESSQKYYVIADAVKVEKKNSNQAQWLDQRFDLELRSIVGAGEGEGESNKEQIDIAFIMDNTGHNAILARGGNDEQFIAGQLQLANNVFAMSQLPIRVKNVGVSTLGIQNVPEAPSIASIMGTMYDTVHVTEPRELAHADVVVLIIDRSDIPYDCGAIYMPTSDHQPTSEESFFIVMNATCVMDGHPILIHELGHALGAGHENELPADRVFPYAVAYLGEKTIAPGNVIRYRTVVSQYDVSRELVPVFSSPDYVVDIEDKVTHAVIATVPVGSATQDNARAVRTMAPLVADYRSPIDDVVLQYELQQWAYDMLPSQRFLHDWFIVSGALPAGLRLTTDGFLDGQVQNAGVFTATVQARETSTMSILGVTETYETIHEGTIAINVQQHSSFQNPRNRLDVNDNGVVEPIDALIIINIINAYGNQGDATAFMDQHPELKDGKHFVDVNGDNQIGPADALAIINKLNGQTSAGEGEMSFNDVDDDGILFLSFSFPSFIFL